MYFPPDKADQKVMQVLGILYCRTVFQDFRKPVGVMYPALFNEYLRAIKEPSDLGTLLLLALEENISKEDAHRRLQLVHKNAADFNQGVPVMEAIALHMETFSSGLFEQILNMPYVRTREALDENEWNVAKRASIEKRYEFVKNQPMNSSELKLVLHAFARVRCPIPKTLVDVVKSKLIILSEILEAHAKLGTDTGIQSSMLLSEIIKDILVISIKGTSGTKEGEGEGEEADKDNIVRDYFTKKYTVEDGDCRVYLEHVHQPLATLLVLMEERLTKGVYYSSVWARPSHTMIWAQPQPLTKDKRHQSMWYPAVILASNSSLYDMATTLMEINLRRMPSDIMAQLVKLRPRMAGISCSNTIWAADNSLHPDFIPEGYILLEFFGSHDFGWVKAELTTAFEYVKDDDYVKGADTGAYTGDDDSKVGMKLTRPQSQKVCSANTIDEAIDALSWLEEKDRYHWETCEEDYDAPLPGSDDLIDSVRIPLMQLMELRAVAAGEKPVSKRSRVSNANKEGKHEKNSLVELTNPNKSPDETAGGNASKSVWDGIQGVKGEAAYQESCWGYEFQ